MLKKQNLPVCILLCIFKEDFCVNRFKHNSHWKGLSPVCILRWMSKYGFLQKAAGQCGQPNGRPCTILVDFKKILEELINFF
jgi:hypothetical protein